MKFAVEPPHPYPTRDLPTASRGIVILRTRKAMGLPTMVQWGDVKFVTTSLDSAEWFMVTRGEEILFRGYQWSPHVPQSLRHAIVHMMVGETQLYEQTIRASAVARVL